MTWIIILASLVTWMTVMWPDLCYAGEQLGWAFYRVAMRRLAADREFKARARRNRQILGNLLSSGSHGMAQCIIYDEMWRQQARASIAADAAMPGAGAMFSLPVTRWYGISVPELADPVCRLTDQPRPADPYVANRLRKGS